jgi:hypothetical protein
LVGVIGMSLYGSRSSQRNRCWRWRPASKLASGRMERREFPLYCLRDSKTPAFLNHFMKQRSAAVGSHPAKRRFPGALRAPVPSFGPLCQNQQKPSRAYARGDPPSHQRRHHASSAARLHISAVCGATIFPALPPNVERINRYDNGSNHQQSSRSRSWRSALGRDKQALCRAIRPIFDRSSRSRGSTPRGSKEVTAGRRRGPKPDMARHLKISGVVWPLQLLRAHRQVPVACNP